jgi:tetratricopeptide (TPR) repeat protein
VIGTVAALALARRRIGSGPLVGVLFFAGTLFPALGFFNVYYMQFSFVADHWQYLACVGPLALIAGTGRKLAERLRPHWRALAAGVAAVVLITLGVLTWRQQRIYRDLDALWRETLAKNPDAWLAHNNLGARLKSQGRVDEAIIHYRAAIRAKPTFADAHNNLAIVLSSRGRLDEAIRHYRLALAAKPNSARIHNNLAGALRAGDRLDEAIGHFRRAVKLEPAFAVAHYNLAATLDQAGAPEDAVPHYREAARLRPEWPLPPRAMAWILATHPDIPGERRVEAVGPAERAAELTANRDAETLDVLAAAYAAAGRFDRAVAVAQAALDRATADGDEQRVQGVRQRLRLYARSEPYVQPRGAERHGP